MGNKVKIVIGGKDFSEHASYPVAVQKTLNDTLDTAQVEMKHLKIKDPFEPFTDVVLKIGGKTENFFVATDEVDEIVGIGLYNHMVTVIEYTKESERILMEAKAFTNPIIPDYTDGQSLANFEVYEEVTESADGSGHYVGNATASSGILSPILIGTDLVIPSITSIVPAGDYGIDPAETQIIKIYYSDSRIPIQYIQESGSYYYTDISGTLEYEGSFGASFNFEKEGFYSVWYRIFGASNGHYMDFVSPIISVSQPVSKEPYTIKNVIETLLSMCIPRRLGDPQKYFLYLTADQEKKISSTAPEFHFSNSRSLWENLREIGRYVHAIPRLEKSGYQTAVKFDDLGGTVYADMSTGHKIARRASYNISSYTSGLESLANNLINADDRAHGSIIEPYNNGWKSLRTASETARIQEGSSYIETAFPIEDKIKLSVYFEYNGNKYSGDITPYLFEKADYDLLLSSSGVYPTSKSYALYYTRGSQNIEGLWFKPNDEVISTLNSFGNYAIVNIICAATGCSTNIFKQITYPDICFRVTYIPTVSARVHNFDPHTSRFCGYLADNQAANKLSAKSLGENMQGQLAMLPTSTESVSYLFRDYDKIPKVGNLFDQYNYISSETIRIYPNFCEAQIDLSTGYNEQGAFVEIPSKFRQFEIPAGETRYTVLDEFCYFSEHYEDDDSDTICGDIIKSSVADVLDGIGNRPSLNITLAEVDTSADDGTVIASGILLPVMSLAIGNSLYFGFGFADNFSAGNQSETGGSEYRMNQAVPYGDKFYGMADRLSFSLLYNANSVSIVHEAHDWPVKSPSMISGTVAATTGEKPLLWYKDSADAGNIAYQLHMMTDSGYIIGTALAQHCTSIRSEPEEEPSVLYVFGHRIHELTGTTDTSDALGTGYSFKATTQDTAGNITGYKITLTVPQNPEGVKAWAIIKAGEFLLGKNSENVPPEIYLNFRREIKEI